MQCRRGMPNLPTTRQIRQCSAPDKKRAADRRSLAKAFLTFTHAAGSLEKSYVHLQGEVGRLRVDLEVANAELARSLQENARVRAFLTRVLEGLPCGILVTDSLGKPHMANPEARRLLKIDVNGTHDFGAVCPPALKSLLAEAPPNSFDAEREWTSEAVDEDRIIGISGARIEGTPGTETIWVLRDISEQKRAAAERETARRAHALAEIATVLAHEIRNPLGSMELFAGLLAGATAHMPEARHWVTHLQAGLRSLAATVNNVLQFHSQPCGELVPIHLDRVLNETVEFLNPLARQSGLRIDLHNLVGRVTVKADAQRLQQVFFNLALNAFRAMAAGGTLTVFLRREPKSCGTNLQVDFQDEGTGIDAELMEKIFEPGITTKVGSPGLGLSVCKKVVEQHGGSIRVESRVQQGSTFSIFLPVSGGQ